MRIFSSEKIEKLYFYNKNDKKIRSLQVKFVEEQSKNLNRYEAEISYAAHQDGYFLLQGRKDRFYMKANDFFSGHLSHSISV